MISPEGHSGEESKAVRRAKRWEAGALDRAARSYARYLRSVEYRKLVEAQDQIAKDTDELKKRIEQSLVLGEELKGDIARVAKGLDG